MFVVTAISGNTIDFQSASEKEESAENIFMNIFQEAEKLYPDHAFTMIENKRYTFHDGSKVVASGHIYEA